MDGNNRWSKINRLTKYQSYSKGAENLLQLANDIFFKTKVNYITAFALSANNLKRSKSLINTIIKILDFNLDQALKKKNNFSISIRGDLRFLSSDLKKKIESLDKNTIDNNKKLIILLNYSGRQDIIETSLKIINSKKKINLENFAITSILSGLPDPELLIRTGGFQRISDFLLFNISFTELFFSKKLWPDFKYSDVLKIIDRFNKIERKFGY